MFLEFKHYLCEHPTDIDNSITILRTRIYKNTMTTEINEEISNDYNVEKL